MIRHMKLICQTITYHLYTSLVYLICVASVYSFVFHHKCHPAQTGRFSSYLRAYNFSLYSIQDEAQLLCRPNQHIKGRNLCRFNHRSTDGPQDGPCANNQPRRCKNIGFFNVIHTHQNMLVISMQDKYVNCTQVLQCT